MTPIAALVLCATAAQPQLPPSAFQPAPGVADRLAEVSPERVHATVEKLESFGTRHTLSDTTSPTQGIGAARTWLRDELQSYSRSLSATLEEFDAPKSVRLPDGAHLANVVAVLPGTSEVAKDRAYYIAGHYDSRNGDAMDVSGTAPGANDDASGVAAVLECARVLAQHPCESTIVFLCTAGEEQGLVGATYHAKQLATEKKFRLVQVLNNDIVGDPSPAQELARASALERQMGEYADMVARQNSENGAAEQPEGGDQNGGEGAGLSTTGRSAGSSANDLMKSMTQMVRPDWWNVRIFSEGLPRGAGAEALARIRSEGAESDSSSRQLARFVSYVAAREQTDIRPVLVFRQDRFLRGGDHAAFNESGFGAVRFTVPAEDYSRQHQNVTEKDAKPYGDLATFVDADYLADVTRLNLATLIHLANAPTPPANARIVTAELSTDTVLKWNASPEPDTAGYEVVYRLTTEPDWTGVTDATNATELRVPLSKDNYFFGVRAYDKDGYRSPVSFAWASKE